MFYCSELSDSACVCNLKFSHIVLSLINLPEVKGQIFKQ